MSNHPGLPDKEKNRLPVQSLSVADRAAARTFRARTTLGEDTCARTSAGEYGAIGKTRPGGIRVSAQTSVHVAQMGNANGLKGDV